MTEMPVVQVSVHCFCCCMTTKAHRISHHILQTLRCEIGCAVVAAASVKHRDAAYSYKQSIVVSVRICWFVGNEHKSRKMAERIMTLFVGADLHGL